MLRCLFSKKEELPQSNSELAKHWTWESEYFMGFEVAYYVQTAA
jgi:hypothetical protein